MVVRLETSVKAFKASSKNQSLYSNLFPRDFRVLYPLKLVMATQICS